MNWENGPLVADEPVEFERNNQLKFKTAGNFTDHFLRNLWNLPQITNRETERCQLVIGWTWKH